MDPTACVARILSAVAARDLAEAGFAVEDLGRWLGRGGFPPCGWTTDQATAFLDVLRVSLMLEAGVALPCEACDAPAGEACGIDCTSRMDGGAS